MCNYHTFRSFSGRYLHSLAISIHCSTSEEVEAEVEAPEEDEGGGVEEEGAIVDAAVLTLSEALTRNKFVLILSSDPGLTDFLFT